MSSQSESRAKQWYDRLRQRPRMVKIGKFIGVCAAILLVAVLGPLVVITYLGTETASVYGTILAALFAGASAAGAMVAVREMQRDRAERNQPLVLVDFDVKSNGAVWIQIKNIGSGLAKDVTFSFDPVPVDFQDRPLTSWSLFQKPLAVLPPGAEHKTLFQVITSLYGKDVPRVFDVEVRCRGEGGMMYARTYHFDFDQFRDMTLPPRAAEEILTELTNETKKITKLLSRNSR